jgi:acetyl-CoA C-acetyltransferase
MGCFAEDCASHYQLTREMQDDYAAASLSRARRAIAEGAFQEEIVPVISGGKVECEIAVDENPRRSPDVDISKLKPAFRADGSITAANSSSISDGAAAVALTTVSEAERMAVQPLARIVGHATYAGPPNQFPTAPIAAIKKLMERVGWRLKDVDLFEINEAFAIVAMVAMRELDIPHEKLNAHGGACALGHPIGASGARIVVTLLAALRKYNLHKGVAALCIGGGEATAIAIERIG